MDSPNSERLGYEHNDGPVQTQKTGLPCTIFPTAYFPPIALAAAYTRQATFLIERQETFPKQTLRNRTVIVTANGPMTLSVPVMRPNGNHTRTKDIQVCYNEPWNRNHWRAITAAYNASPFFLYYQDELEALLHRQYELLTELNEAILSFVIGKLKLPIHYIYTDEYRKDIPTEKDFRSRYDYKQPETQPHLPSYTQVFSDRLPFNGNVSILDLLFNLGPDTAAYLRGIKV